MSNQLKDRLSEYKKIALEFLHEDVGEESIESIAQTVLDKHIQMDENEFNSDLMPDESVIPDDSSYYRIIKDLVKRALEKNQEDVSDVDITR